MEAKGEKEAKNWWNCMNFVCSDPKTLLFTHTTLGPYLATRQCKQSSPFHRKHGTKKNSTERSELQTEQKNGSSLERAFDWLSTLPLFLFILLSRNQNSKNRKKYIHEREKSRNVLAKFFFQLSIFHIVYVTSAVRLCCCATYERAWRCESKSSESLTSVDIRTESEASGGGEEESCYSKSSTFSMSFGWIFFCAAMQPLSLLLSATWLIHPQIRLVSSSSAWIEGWSDFFCCVLHNMWDNRQSSDGFFGTSWCCKEDERGRVTTVKWQNTIRVRMCCWEQSQKLVRKLI